MQNKEIDQRADKELLFRCNCGGSHFLAFSWDTEEPSWGFYIEIIDYPSDLWSRITKSINYIFNGGKLYWSGIGLTSKDLEKLKKHINEYIEAINKGRK